MIRRKSTGQHGGEPPLARVYIVRVRSGETDVRSVISRVKMSLARRRHKQPEFTDELGPWERQVLAHVTPFTMTSAQRIVSLTEAVRYVVGRGIPGAFAECGVWRGGSVLAMILTLQDLGVTDRDIYLYDTFDGMTKPTDVDTSDYFGSALGEWQSAEREGNRAFDLWFNEDVFNIDLVKRVLDDTGYPTERLHIIQGTVEETIPVQAPEHLALLRLDTDWYESTHHELIHLYPRIETGGVLIIDDYGAWKGCRKAVDEYFAGQGAPRPLLNRVDHTGRLAVKV